MDPSRKRLLYGIGIGLALLTIFLLGYMPGRSRARQAAAQSESCAQQLSELQASLANARLDAEVARSRGRLGELLLEAQANNFGTAGEKASVFFDGLRTILSNPQLQASQRRGILEGLLNRRDEISADLARADAGVKGKLNQMYVQFAGAL